MEWNKGGLAEIVVDKVMLMLYAITRFHHSEQSQIAIGYQLTNRLPNNQPTKYCQKQVASCVPITFFLNTNQPKHPKSSCT